MLTLARRLSLPTRRHRALAAIALVAVYAAFQLYRALVNRYRKRQCSLPGSMQSSYLLNKHGMWLYTRKWLQGARDFNRRSTLTDPRGVVFVVHGYGEHSGRHEHWAQEMAHHGFDVYAMDHQGHGMSDCPLNAKGYFLSIEDVVDDYVMYINTVVSKYKIGAPHGMRFPSIFLVGHSWGGMLAAYIADRLPQLFAGVVLTAPLFRGSKDLEDFRPLGRVRQGLKMLTTALPTLRFKGVDMNTLCHVQSVREHFDWDPLSLQGDVPLSVGLAFLDATDENRLVDIAEAVHYPLLCIHGDEDRVTTEHGSRLFVNACSSVDKTLKIIQGGYHELLNEGTWRSLLHEIEQWMTCRIRRE